MSKSTFFKAGLIFILSMGSIVVWHLRDNRPSSLDETKHMLLAMDYRDWIVEGTPLQNPWDHVYPPAYHFSIIPAMSIGVANETKATLSHGLYIMIFIIGCFLFGRAQERPYAESLAAALLCLGYGYVVWASRRALIDFPLMCWTMFAMGLLARTRGFSLRKESLEFGLALGIGLLIKFTFGFFFLLPIVWTYFRNGGPARIKNCFLALAVGGILGGSWYFWNSAFFLDKAFGLANEPTVANGDPRTLAGWLFYLRCWHEQMGVPNMIFTSAGLVLTLVAGFFPRQRDDGFLWAWFLSGYLILSATINKDMRHTLPILPAAAFLAIRGWRSILPERGSAPILFLAAAILFASTVFTYDLPAKENWPNAEIGRLMAERHDATQPFLAASVLSHQPRFFPRGLKWILREQNINLRTTGAGDPDSSFVEYILVRRGTDGTGYRDEEEEWKGTEHDSRAFKTLYPLIGQYRLPDQSDAYLYQRRAHPQFEVAPRTPEAVAAHLAHTLKRFIEGPLKITVRSSSQGLVDGHLEEISASCDGCRFKGMALPPVKLYIAKPWLNLYNLWDQDRIGFLAFESVSAKMTLPAKYVEVALAKVKGLSEPKVEFTDGKIRIQARLHGIRVGAVAHTDLSLSGPHPYLDAVLDRISIAGIPLPGWIIGKAYRQTLWLEPQPSFPGRVNITRVTVNNNQLILE